MASIANYPVNWDGTADDQIGLGATYDRLGQTFIVNSGGPYSPTSVDIPIAAVSAGQPPGIVTVAVYAVDGSGFPTGSILSSGTFDASVLSILSPPRVFSSVDVNIAMSAASLVTGTTYILVMSISTGWVKWFGTTANGYPSGSPKHRLTSGSTWENETGIGDFGFRLFGDTITSLPDKPINPTPTNGATGQRLNLPSFTWEAG